MRAHVEIATATRNWTQCRVTTDSDLFVILNLGSGDSHLQIRLSGQDLDEVEKAIKKIQMAKRRMKSVA